MLRFSCGNEIIKTDDNKGYLLKKIDNYYRQFTKEVVKKNTYKKKKINYDDDKINFFNNTLVIGKCDKDNYEYLCEIKNLYKNNYKYIKDNGLVKKINMVRNLI